MLLCRYKNSLAKNQAFKSGALADETAWFFIKSDVLMMYPLRSSSLTILFHRPVFFLLNSDPGKRTGVLRRRFNAAQGAGEEWIDGMDVLLLN